MTTRDLLIIGTPVIGLFFGLIAAWGVTLVLRYPIGSAYLRKMAKEHHLENQIPNGFRLGVLHFGYKPDDGRVRHTAGQ